MSTYRPYKEAIDFDEIKRQRKSIDIDISVNREHAINFPDSKKEAEQEIMNLQAKIPVLDAILAKEPPPPELPPGKPLIKVSGVLEEFEALCVMGYFTDREYDLAAFSRQDEWEVYRRIRRVIAGNRTNSQIRVSGRDVCDFVRGKINGIPFHGWLGFTTVKEGDYVELAVTEQEGHYVVYAIAHPELRVVSMTPRCKQGIHSDAKYQICVIWCGSLVIFSMFMIAWVFFIREYIVNYIKNMASFCGLMAMVLSPLVYSSCMRNPKPTLRLAEEICTVLGFPNPTKINLEKLTRKRLKKIKVNSPDGKLHKSSKRVLPDKDCYSSYYYYY
ncbi:MULTISPECIES: putative type VI secretion system effector [Photorhabdus]|uniref:Membrane Protein n=2 Tax=Photorhabdus asymbiotica TaxID=291112 RepID=B6VLD8_PHOAA|nr:putative type VI secretion system effector [Photorhabdus asymbiotica]RKS59768.1 hypothetical protein BDD30_1855 [Photorhabdus asymbiotica]CAQ85912.1 Putative membrane Protein [Photorhabdus asymbiotica]CAR66968.1 Putative membrane Protein [Photorhabdus asymbiotica subsp. asymbiotica ATCC 43949]